MGIKRGKNVMEGLGGVPILKRIFPGVNVKREITHVLGNIPVKD